MWTIPNIVTLSRIAMLPLIVVLIWPGIENRETSFWSAIAFAVAASTDFIDGYLARRLNQVSVMGKFLDPLADKLFYLVTMIALLQLPGPRLPFWIVMVVLTRELAITGLRAIASSEGLVIAAGQGGKIKTAVGMVGMVFLLIHYSYWVNFGFFGVVVDFHTVGLWLTYISVVYSITSAYSYMRLFARSLEKREESQRPAS